MSFLFGYLYKKKPFGAFRGPYMSIHQSPYTKVHTPTYIYIAKKLKMSIYFGYLYKKKTLSSFQRSIHPYTCTPTNSALSF